MVKPALTCCQFNEMCYFVSPLNALGMYFGKTIDYSCLITRCHSTKLYGENKV